MGVAIFTNLSNSFYAFVRKFFNGSMALAPFCMLMACLSFVCAAMWS